MTIRELYLAFPGIAVHFSYRDLVAALAAKGVQPTRVGARFDASDPYPDVSGHEYASGAYAVLDGLVKKDSFGRVVGVTEPGLVSKMQAADDPTAVTCRVNEAAIQRAPLEGHQASLDDYESAPRVTVSTPPRRDEIEAFPAPVGYRLVRWWIRGTDEGTCSLCRKAVADV